MSDANIIPLGERLYRKQLITEAQWKQAIELQANHGGAMGRVLSGEGFVSLRTLHQELAEQSERPFVDLLAMPPDEELLETEQVHNYIRLNFVPWQRDEQKIYLATSGITQQLDEWATEYYGLNYEFVMTSPIDIRRTVEANFSHILSEESCNKLAEENPEQSAKVSLLPSQRNQLAIALALILGMAIISPAGAVFYSVLIANIFYIATIIFKSELFVIGHSVLKRRKKQPIAKLTLLDKALPTYTILIPLYKEAASVPGLIQALRRLDYPRAKLDIKLIVEAGDEETIVAIKAAKPESCFELIRVPFSLPQTKPKACNYALHFARGEMVTIYDAEDRPDPMQLRKVVALFRRNAKLGCVQARLNYYNREENILTRLFAIEYAGWFEYLLPALEALRIPIPLGGTSNHIPLKVLREVGAWDPYNVTEDADLGVRLAIAGYRTAVVDSLTLEEAPITLVSWLKQRTRWVKGYMQTWLVHMRHPLKLYRSIGAVGFWGFQFFVGGPCLVFLLAPFMWALSLLWAFGLLVPTGLTLPGWLVMVAAGNLFLGLFSHYLMAMTIVHKRGWRRMDGAMLVFPLYWLLHSLASMRAVWQLVRCPHFWDKTTHGVSKIKPKQQLVYWSDAA